jgi:hypothetical protein
MTYPTTSASIYANLALSTGTVAPNSYYVSNDANNSWSVNTSASGTLTLQGENADIKVNDKSLMNILQDIQDYLRIPPEVPRDAGLEAEYQELRQAGEHYESLLKQYKQKRQVWETLKKQF